MAFMRYANAVVVSSSVTEAGWGKVRTGAATLNPSRNLAAQASDILGESFDPKKYLLSHATIVASVDVEVVPNVKLGQTKEDGKKIHRKYADYFVTPNTSMFVNSNGDCFSREVLKKAYKTFVGGFNFLEHLQITDLAKGRIIDAVARDIGDSLYIDILIATDRKHTELVSDILSGKMGTLSMGASVSFTVCTKCGHVAADETELCDHVKYAKRDHFYDSAGNKRIIAELCGHESVDGGGVHFIEASWVKTPAFTGAVLRNILDPGQVGPQVLKSAQEILSSPPVQWTSPKTFQSKAASRTLVSGEDLDPSGADDTQDDSTVDPFDELEQDITQKVVDKVREQIESQMEESSDDGVLDPNSNDNVLTQACRKLASEAKSDVEFLNKVAELEGERGLDLVWYRTLLKVGPFTNLRDFLGAVVTASGRIPSHVEAEKLVRLSKFLSNFGQSTPPKKS